MLMTGCRSGRQLPVSQYLSDLLVPALHLVGEMEGKVVEGEGEKEVVG